MMALEYSVLMSVYHKENPNYLEESINSMLSQTVPTNDFVIVCDGPLTEELDAVLAKYEENPVINIVRLDENHGLGLALNYGIKSCVNELIARMDSDDISSPERCEKQLKIFNRKDIDVVGSNISEFCENPKELSTERQVPKSNGDIFLFAQKRNPINHVTVMFKKSKVLECGNYQNFNGYEDYNLWVRMLMQGHKFYNIQESLVYVRTNENMFMRRGGLSYLKDTKKFQDFLLKSKFISPVRYMMNLCERGIVQVLMPNGVRKIFYKMILRK